MGSFKDVALRWFIYVMFYVIGVRTLKYRFDISIVFNNDFFVDLIIAGLSVTIIEFIYYNRSRKKV